MAFRVVPLFVLWLTALVGSYAITSNMMRELDRVSEDVSTYPYHKDFKTCPISIDIAYLIDGSDSISTDDYDLEKTIVKVMAYFFGVMKLGTHEGVVNYGETARTEITFQQFEKFEPFRDAVKALRKIGGGTRIDRALEETYDNLLNGNGGARVSTKIPKVVVIFTDGVSGGQQLDIAVRPLLDAGVIVHVIGVGQNINDRLNTLRQLTSRDDLVYTATSFLDAYIKAGFFARTICQHAQFRGNMGPTGPQGADGPAGQPGPIGEDGVPGNRGNRGSTGPKGFRGTKGPIGDSGTPGTPGADGSPGPQGSKGPKGQRGGPGAEGPRGPSGDPGNDGDDGPRGPTGFPGSGGQKGDAGENGINGNPGTDGTPGRKGPTGDAGDRGDEGSPGADQPNGAPGAKGQPGAAGNVGGSGVTGSPGPKGDPGPRGPDGDRGPAGDPGTRGRNGVDGADGDPGNDGSRGPRGPLGSRGAKGFQGSRGNDGVNGFPGPRGPIGPNGVDGSDANQSISCVFRQSATGNQDMSCNDLSYTATDCGCSRGCGEWSISSDGQTCACKCNSYVPSSFYSVGVQCCRLQ